VSFRTLALGWLHLCVVRHIGVGMAQPLSFDTSVTVVSLATGAARRRRSSSGVVPTHDWARRSSSPSEVRSFRRSHGGREEGGGELVWVWRGWRGFSGCQRW
jgi:hypothetical protein